MLDSIDLPHPDMLAVPRGVLASLRAALARTTGATAASDLQEAGYAGGDALFASFAAWLRSRDQTLPESLDLATFERNATAYFRATGWGSLTIGTLRDLVATVDSSDWGEAEPGGAAGHPACHLTTGLFADFFGRLAGQPLAVLEVECRSAGDARCRFLLGNADVMNAVYDRMARGTPYQAAVAAIA